MFVRVPKSRLDVLDSPSLEFRRGIVHPRTPCPARPTARPCRPLTVETYTICKSVVRQGFIAPTRKAQPCSTCVQAVARPAATPLLRRSTASPLRSTHRTPTPRSIYWHVLVLPTVTSEGCGWGYGWGCTGTQRRKHALGFAGSTINGQQPKSFLATPIVGLLSGAYISFSGGGGAAASSRGGGEGCV